MYIINDIELLERLAKHRVLEHVLCNCSLCISAIRLNDYSFSVRQAITALPHIKLLQVDEGFDSWFVDKRRYLSISDLSSIYVAFINCGSTLVLSVEDGFLIAEAKKNSVAYLGFDDFIVSTIQDKKMIQLYNLIKAA